MTIEEPEEKGSNLNLPWVPEGLYFFELNDGECSSVEKVFIR